MIYEVFKNVALVYAEPITDDIAAANNTIPKIFFPIGPIACSKLTLVDFQNLVSHLLQQLLIPRNSNVLIIPVVKIPAIAD